VLKEAKWAVAVSLIATLLLLFVAYTAEVRHDNLAKEHGWQTLRVCGRTFRIPAGAPADDYKKAASLDCGFLTPPRHPRIAPPRCASNAKPRSGEP
jgi:hypothetical protein